MIYHNFHLRALLCSGAFLFLTFGISAQAGSATWNLNPTSNDWSTAANWTPNTVPNSPSDIATFAVSNSSAASIAFPPIELDSIIFSSGATPFSVTVGDTIGSVVTHLTLSGGGIINNSGVVQQFFANPTMERENDPDNVIIFEGGATAGDLTQFTAMGARSTFARLGGEIRFMGTSSAGSGNFINATGTNGGYGGFTSFLESSTAGNGTFTNKASSSSTDFAGSIIFSDTSNAGAAMFTNEPNNAGDIGVPIIIFFASSSAADGTFVSMGGTTSAASGGRINFYDNSTAGNATLTINGGSNSGGGSVLSFLSGSSGGTARVEVFGNGNFDISSHDASDLTTGSLEGDGDVFLGANNLSVGTNNLATTFSGVIQDGGIGGGNEGSFTKVGTGRLILTGANTYTGGTVISGGTLLVNNRTGSGLGSASVQAVSGTLGGVGFISGDVTMGSGQALGAILEPGRNSVMPGTLTLRNRLILKADSTYRVTINSSIPAADSVVASGVRIEGAQIAFRESGSATVPPGTVFTVINNNSANPINGIFADLADGAVVHVGRTNYHASYSGGDGNDLTLTVVQ